MRAAIGVCLLALVATSLPAQAPTVSMMVGWGQISWGQASRNPGYIELDPDPEAGVSTRLSATLPLSSRFDLGLAAAGFRGAEGGEDRMLVIGPSLRFSLTPTSPVYLGAGVGLGWLYQRYLCIDSPPFTGCDAGYRAEGNVVGDLFIGVTPRKGRVQPLLEAHWGGTIGQRGEEIVPRRGRRLISVMVGMRVR